MGKYYALYNPRSSNGKGEEKAHRLDHITLNRELEYVDITKITDYKEFFGKLSEDDGIILCGGDGTLSHFANDTYSIPYSNEVLFFGCGIGNDFLRDIGGGQGDRPIPINKYLRNLPTVTVKGKTYHFINNVGFGIDGYCTMVGDEMRAQHKGNINYAAIAIRGMLGGFHPVTATITVDGKTETFRHTWLAPTMNGRYYGGGMMAAPEQDRLNPEHKVSVLVIHQRSKIKTLTTFPSLFTGEHVKHTDMVRIFTGHTVKVVFDRPSPLQIDGETIRDVTEYEVHSAVSGQS